MEFKNYIRLGSKRKWYHVIAFRDLPHDNPGKSKEGTEWARFAGLGDAWTYVQGKMKQAEKGGTTLDPHALIVIR